MLLSRPFFYKTWKSLVTSQNRTSDLAERYLSVPAGSQVIDLGCGVGDFACFFTDHSTYVGVDSNPYYIKIARQTVNSDKAIFLEGDVGNIDLSQFGNFDLVMMSGVLHHLDTKTALAALTEAKKLMSDSGRFFAIEPVFEPGQSLIARLTIASDRGQYVRDTEGYRNVLSQLFEEVEIDVRHDVIRIPYTHAVITARKPKKATFEH